MPNPSSRSDFWRPHVEACASSGLSVAAYAKSNNVSVCQMHYWRAKLGHRQPKAFAAVRAERTAPPVHRRLELRLPGGVTVTVTSAEDLPLLRDVVRALESHS